MKKAVLSTHLHPAIRRRFMTCFIRLHKFPGEPPLTVAQFSVAHLFRFNYRLRHQTCCTMQSINSESYDIKKFSERHSGALRNSDRMPSEFLL